MDNMFSNRLQFFALGTLIRTLKLKKSDKIKVSEINLTEELKGDVINMCNYSQYIATSGYEKGVYEEKIKAAKNFFSHGFTLEDVRKMYPDLTIDLLAYLKSESDSQKSE